MTGESGDLDLGFVAEGEAARRRMDKRRTVLALMVSAVITVAWLAYVVLSGMWDRLARHVSAAVTMVFGSFVAGSTPQGGGAVAFPVFTKGLGISTEVARSFSLFVQTVGMGAASAAILIKRRRIEWRAVAYGIPIAAAAFLLTVFLLGDRSDPFLRPILPSSYVRVTFTLIVAAMAFITFLASRVRIREVTPQIRVFNQQTRAALMIVALIGGIASGLTGSGADVLIYLFVGVLLAVEMKVGVPTSVLVMTGVSMVGFVALGLIDGQLSVTVVGDRVTEVGGKAVDLDAATFDVFGLWLAAVPVVAWGAPLGAWVASRITTRRLVVFVITLAAAEVISTALFLPELRTDPWLLVYTLAGGLGIGLGLWWLAGNRQRVFGQPGVGLSRSLGRRDLDVAEGYKEQLDSGGEDAEE